VNGRVLVDTASGISLPSHQRRVGLVFQDAQLFPHMTVGQNLAFGRWFSPADRRSLDRAGILDALDIEPLLGRRPAGLSGGEKQRVALARALLAAPEILLMDEPLGGLDEERKAEILPLIERTRDTFGIPIVYVTHDAREVARLASQVVLLASGRVTTIGIPSQIMTPPQPSGAAAVQAAFQARSIVWRKPE
jgi:molybdate transport system ATP-binding protein